MSSRKKNKLTFKKVTPTSLTDILKSDISFEDIEEISRSEDIEAVAFKLRGTKLLLEKHSRENIKLLRLINSFNPKGMDIDKNPDNLINTANKFNSGSIGIKCSIIDANEINLVVFSIEEISINEKMLNISSESLRTIAAILSGAPALFEKLGKAKSKE